MRNAHFCVIAQRVAVISYRRFRTTYRSHFQGSILHVVDSEINEAAFSLGSSHMSESYGPRSSSSSSPLLLLLLRRKKQSRKGKKQEQKRTLFILFCFLPSLLQLSLSSHYLSVFLWTYCNRKKIRKKKNTNRIYSLTDLFINLLTYIYIFIF